jgi:hypothetical protein
VRLLADASVRAVPPALCPIFQHPRWPCPRIRVAIGWIILLRNVRIERSGRPVETGATYALAARPSWYRISKKVSTPTSRRSGETAHRPGPPC